MTFYDFQLLILEILNVLIISIWVLKDQKKKTCCMRQSGSGEGMPFNAIYVVSGSIGNVILLK